MVTGGAAGLVMGVDSEDTKFMSLLDISLAYIGSFSLEALMVT